LHDAVPIGLARISAVVPPPAPVPITTYSASPVLFAISLMASVTFQPEARPLAIGSFMDILISVIRGSSNVVELRQGINHPGGWSGVTGQVPVVFVTIESHVTDLAQRNVAVV